MWDGRLVVRPRKSIDDMVLPAPVFVQDPNILERGQPDWQQMSKMIPGVGPSGWLDPQIAAAVEAEFRKGHDYQLVDSAQEADLIFLVEGLYRCYWSPDGSRLNFFLADDSSAWANQQRTAAIAIAVPAEVYRRNPDDPEALLAARTWEGIVCYHMDIMPPSGPRGLPGGVIGGREVRDANGVWKSADPKQLVKQFLNNAKWPADVPPIVPAWMMLPSSTSEDVSVTLRYKMDELGRGATAKTPTASDVNHVFRANTTLVSVPVIARDAEGRSVSGLQINDFRVCENGVQQEIARMVSESAPFHAALMVDISRSTGLARPDIENAALAFMGELRPDDELMVLAFTNKVYVESEFTHNMDQLRRAIAEMDKHAGGTPDFGDDLMKWARDKTKRMGTRLYDALDLALTERLHGLSGRKAILIFSDGVDSGSRLASLQSTLARIEEADVLVYAVQYDTPTSAVHTGINRDVDEGLAAAHRRGAEYLEQLAIQSGGRFFKASTMSTYRAAFSQIAEEIGHQYTLYYYPKDPITSAEFRRIQVVVDKPGIKISARAGYRPVPTK